jgi:hypothetical protein
VTHVTLWCAAAGVWGGAATFLAVSLWRATRVLQELQRDREGPEDGRG